MYRHFVLFAGLLLAACQEPSGPRPAGPIPRESPSATELCVHFAHDDTDPEHADVLEMFDHRPGYTVELAYAVSQHPEWIPGLRDKIRSIADAGFEVILRIDYRGAVNVPPTDEIETYLDFVVEQMVVPLGDVVGTYVVGNEPNLDVECLEGLEYCSPEHYAEVYRATREAIHEQDPRARVLVAGLSPGPRQGGRWKSSDEYWSELLVELDPSEIDGVAVHAYGGGDRESSIAMFRGDVRNQLALLHNAGLADTPVYITELNRQTQGADDEATSARFLADAYGWLQDWNSAESPKIAAACWYYYKRSPKAEGYSLRDLASPDASPDQDVWQAFRAVARGDTESPGPQTAGHAVHRAFSPGLTDHLYTVDLAETSAPGYALEHSDYFFLADHAAPGTTTLWRCYSAQETDHLYTQSASCEGAEDMVRESAMGFIATDPFPGTTPLFRLYKRGDHFYTTSEAEASAAETHYGYAREGIAGYVW